MSNKSELKAKPWRIAVLMGGQSPEAEVSRSSAKEVADALRSRGHHARELELDGSMHSKLVEMDPDVVFPALHGPPGEDGTVQGFLEIMSLPYVGSNVHGSAIAMDKDFSKVVYRRAGLPVAEDLIFRSLQNLPEIERQILDVLGSQIVIKPLRQGSALGVSRLSTADELSAGLEAAYQYDGGIMVEQFIQGREITVGVLDLEGKAIQSFPVIEIRTAQNEWYDFNNRYKQGASEHLVPAPITDALALQLRAIAIKAHEHLSLRDLSRSDFIVTEDDDIFLLETNTMPGMTPTSLYPDGARATGIKFDELMEKLVTSALRRALNN